MTLRKLTYNSTTGVQLVVVITRLNDTPSSIINRPLLIKTRIIVMFGRIFEYFRACMPMDD